MRYIAFLRAVNVGGRTVKMDRLRELFTTMGFKNVRTYIQSGNVFFDSAQKNRNAIEAKIEERLHEALGFAVPAFVRTTTDIERAISLDPFKNIKITPDTRLSVIFLSEPLPGALDWPVRSPKRDIELLQATLGEVFAVHQHIDGRASNPVAFVERTFRVAATARFFATLGKIAEASKLP